MRILWGQIPWASLRACQLGEFGGKVGMDGVGVRRKKQKKKNVYRLAKTNKNPTARLC